MKSIDISSRLYDYRVVFTDHISDTLYQFQADSTAYVIDSRVFSLYGELFSSFLQDHIFPLEATEQRKTMDYVMELIGFFSNLGVRKNWKVLCIGGGITQDITTIACDLYLRNVPWYFVPTTLLAMCDSCIGGKCGINYGPYKNQIGVFYPPKEIYIDIAFLGTLTTGDYLNGWGELLKFSLTNDPDFYFKLREEKQYIPCDDIGEYIYRGLCVKKGIIEADEFESDLRRVLNYGHTFGHALEAYTNHSVSHGQAVIWGIDVADYLSVREGLLDRSVYQEIKALIRRGFFPNEITVEDPSALFEIIKTDKKVRGNTLSFALPDALSHLIVYPMSIDEKLKKMFEDYIDETHEYYSR